MRLLRFLRNEFLYNGHLQSIGAAGLVYISGQLLFSAQLPFVLILAEYLVFEKIFIFDRYHDIDWDSLTNSERSRHLALYRKKIPYIFVLFLLSAVGLFLLYASWAVFFANIVIFVFGILYPILFKKITRYIPLFKNFYVSSVYAILPIIPMLYLGRDSSETILAIHMPIVIFVECFVAQIILDTKDTESDKRAHLQTLSVLVGNKKAVMIALGLSTVLALVSSAISVLTKAPILFFVLTLFALAIDVVVITLTLRKSKKGYFLAAAKFLFWSLCFGLFQFLL